MCACWNCKHVIKLLKCALFRFGDEKEDHDQCSDIEATVCDTVSMTTKASWMKEIDLQIKAERAHNSELLEQSWESHRENARPEETCSDRPGHTDLAMGQWEDFGRVSERNRSFAR